MAPLQYASVTNCDRISDVANRLYVAAAWYDWNMVIPSDQAASRSPDLLAHSLDDDAAMASSR